MEQTPDKENDNFRKDGKEQFNRSIGLIPNFALGFTYPSPLTAAYSLFAPAVTLAGPPAVWWILIVACGQLLVALVFDEVAPQYLITGGLYSWARRLWSKKYAWIAAWIYLWVLVVTITSIAEYASTFVEPPFHYGQTPTAMLVTPVLLLLLMMAVNMSGTKNLARVAKTGFWCEIVSVIALGTYLLVFHRSQPFFVIFGSTGVLAHDGSYSTAFMSAALMGLFMFSGFEACGNVAEEVQNPSKKIPVVTILNIVFGAISAIISVMGYLPASPNLVSIVNGKTSDPISAALNEALGETGAIVFIVVATIVMLSCILSLQAALSRLIFSFSHDRMLLRNEWMAKISKNGVPDNAMVVSCLLPIIICVWVYFQPDNLSRITAFVVIRIYISFQMIVLAVLRQRLKGWKPVGEWTTGGWGVIVNVLALAYELCRIWLLAQPADSSDFIDRWMILFGLVTVVGSGLIYMFLTCPFGRLAAPENDAIAYANKLNMGQGN